MIDSIKQEWVFFDCKKSKELFEAIKKRVVELGYEYNYGNESINIAIHASYYKTYSCIDLKYARERKESFLEGDLNILFGTEDYKYGKPIPTIVINGYKVFFKDCGITIGPNYISKETILEIAKFYQD